jgi:drug/metabolite transporter (DMT)-like permease
VDDRHAAVFFGHGGFHSTAQQQADGVRNPDCPQLRRARDPVCIAGGPAEPAAADENQTAAAAMVFALEFTLPAWGLLLSVLVLGERLTKGRIIVIVMGLIGCLVILRPGIQAFQPAALLVLACSFFYAVFNVYTKKMTATETTFGIVFWMNLLQFPLGLAGSDPLFVLRLEPWQFLPLACVGIAGLFAHYCIANAFRYGDASVVIPLDFLRVPLIAVVGWMFFAESVDALVFVGAGIILAGILWNLRAEAKNSTQNTLLPEDEGLPEPRK